MARPSSATPIVSVVVPCFNQGRFLREALVSIGTPDVPTEVVVVDDGSTDDTPQVIASFGTPNLFRPVRQPNAGLAAARNRGLRESQGVYVIFLDADDRLAEGAVDLARRVLEKHADCAFAYGRCQMMDRDGTPVPTPRQPCIARDHYRELLRRNHIWMPAMAAFRRAPLQRIGGFNQGFDAAADYEAYLRIARQYPVYDHGQLVAYYRKHDANMSSNAARMLRETLAVMRTQRAFIDGDEAALAAYREGCRNWQDHYGTELVNEIRRAARRGRLAEAAAKTLTLARYHPRGLWHHARRKTELTLIPSRRSDLADDLQEVESTPLTPVSQFRQRRSPPRDDGPLPRREACDRAER
jgi:glycosyltransferase involved in cell wall biosynthesis